VDVVCRRERLRSVDVFVYLGVPILFRVLQVNYVVGGACADELVLLSGFALLAFDGGCVCVEELITTVEVDVLVSLSSMLTS
jgi:hypothetical protein